MSCYPLVVREFPMANALGQERMVVILKNEHGRFAWRLVYPGDERWHTYSYNWFRSDADAARSARRFMRTLAQ